MKPMRRMAVAAHTLACMALLFAQPSGALDPNKSFSQYVLDAWATDNGLPQNTVYCITQTQDGFLWVGTEEGLARFDGVRFTPFNKGNSPEIRSNYINALLEDPDGNLWIGTYGGGLSKYRNGRFTHFGKEEGLPDDHIVCLFFDRERTLWIGTTHGLSRFRGGSFQSFSTQDGLSDNWIVSIVDDHAGGVWIGTARGLCRLINKRFEAIPAAGTQVIYSLYSPAPEDLWIGTFNTLKHIRSNQLENFMLETNLPNVPVRAIHRDTDRNLWIATLGAGVNRFRDGKLEAFTMENGMSSNMIHAFYEDREGSLWIGTSEGLSRLKNGKFVSYSTAEGLSFNRVWCVYENHQHQIWIGTDGGGLNVFDQGKFTHFTIRDGLSSNLISSLTEDQAGNLWVGTLGAGLNKYEHGKFVHYTFENGLSGNWIWSIYPDHRGSVWIGTFNRGLNRLKDGVFIHYDAHNGFPAQSVHSIYEAPNGAVYFATADAGLVRWKDDVFTTYSTKQGFPSDDLISMYGDSEGTLWLSAASQGLIWFKNGQSRKVTQKDGLLYDTIEGILEDNHGNLWMSTNRGIFTVNKKVLQDFVSGKIHHFEIKTFGKSDGMKSEECNGGYQPSAWKSHDGRLWFSTIKGVVVIDPEKIPVNRLPPPVLMQDVIVDDEQVSQTGRGIEFQPGKQHFEFHYTALSLLDPAKVNFKFKLEGFDRDWIQAGARRVAYYTNLPSGSYQFRVQACNNDGVWNEAGAVFTFRLDPHVYETTWFYLLCAAFVLSAGFAVHRYRLKQIHSRFDAILSERNRLARELHDTLAQGITGVITQLEAAEEIHPGAPDQSMQHVSRARELARQNLAEARRTIRGMRPQYLERGPLGAALGRAATDLTSGTGIELDIRIEGEDRPLPALIEDNLLRIAQEAVHNCVKYAGAKLIQLELRYRSHDVELRITDDGSGFDVGTALDKDGHFGLLGIQERAKQLGGHANIRSSSGAGTEIRISLPTG